MGKTEWSRYFRLSLLLHLVILSLGGALLYAQRSLPEKSLGPIRIHLAEPDPGKNGTSGGKGGNTGLSSNGVSGGGHLAPAENQAGTRNDRLEQLLEAPSLVNDQGKVRTRGETVTGTEAVPGETASLASGSMAGGELGTETNGEGGKGTGPGDGEREGIGGNGSSGQDLSCDATLLPFDKEYPLASRKAGEEGVPVVRVLINADGSVASASLEESSGYDRLDRTALQVARKWHFLPARDAAGTAISCRKSISIRYTLE